MPGYSGMPVSSGRVNEKTIQQLIKLSLQDMQATGYTRINYGDTYSTVNATLATIAAQNNGRVPTGCLGGSVVVTRGDNIIGPPVAPVVPGTTNTNLAQKPQGILVRDVAGMAWEGTITDDANRATHCNGPQNIIAVSVYETRRRNQPGGPNIGIHSALAANDLVYAAGDFLYVDMFSGLLTNQVPLDVGGFQPLWDANATAGNIAFSVATVRNGVWPFPYAEVVATSWEGTNDLLIKLLQVF